MTSLAVLGTLSTLMHAHTCRAGNMVLNMPGQDVHASWLDIFKIWLDMFSGPVDIVNIIGLGSDSEVRCG